MKVPRVENLTMVELHNLLNLHMCLRILHFSQSLLLLNLCCINHMRGQLISMADQVEGVMKKDIPPTKISGMVKGTTSPRRLGKVTARNMERVVIWTHVGRGPPKGGKGKGDGKGKGWNYGRGKEQYPSGGSQGKEGGKSYA